MSIALVSVFEGNTLILIIIIPLVCALTLVQNKLSIKTGKNYGIAQRMNVEKKPIDTAKRG